LNWTNLLIVFALSIAIFILYSLANMYFLHKLKVSKWLVLILGLVFLFVGLIMPIYTENIVLQYLPTGFFVFLFLWYADLSGLSRIGVPKDKNKNQPVIKPKAKPNKLKYIDEKDILKTTSEKSKKKNKKA